MLIDVTHPQMRPTRGRFHSRVCSAGERAIRDAFVDGIQVVPEGSVQTIDYVADLAELEVAQRRALKDIPNFDWAGCEADEIAPPSLPYATGQCPFRRAYRQQRSDLIMFILPLSVREI